VTWGEIFWGPLISPMPSSKITPVILLVDDEPMVVSVFCKALEHEGYRVVTAHTAGEALIRAKQLGRIDLLATDVVLLDKLRLATHHQQRPTMHGIDLTRRLVAMQPGIKFILFSGQQDDLLKSLGGIPPTAKFLRKPFAAETLIRVVQEALAEAQAPARRK
jgi:CheY-like chemotaxis protein